MPNTVVLKNITAINTKLAIIQPASLIGLLLNAMMVADGIFMLDVIHLEIQHIANIFFNANRTSTTTNLDDWRSAINAKPINFAIIRPHFHGISNLWKNDGHVFIDGAMSEVHAQDNDRVFINVKQFQAAS